MTDPTSLGHWIRRFLMEYAASERNLSANTRASYRDMLVLLVPYAARHKRAAIDELSVTDLSAEVVRAFLAYLEGERRCCTATRNQRLASIHALARFIAEHSPQHLDWFTQLRMVPMKKGVTSGVTCLEKAEVDALLAAPDQTSNQGRRDYALLLFLYNSGARVSEAASVRIGDIDWHSKSVQIVGKGVKKRRCPLWKSTIEHLRRLAGQRPVDTTLFLNRRGEHSRDTAFTRSSNVTSHACAPPCRPFGAGGSVPMSSATRLPPTCCRQASTSIRSEPGSDTCRLIPPTSTSRSTSQQRSARWQRWLGVPREG